MSYNVGRNLVSKFCRLILLAVTISFFTSQTTLADSVVAWGGNNYGQLGDGTTQTSLTPVPVIGLDSGVIAVATGYYHKLALKNGVVYAWGANDIGQLGDGTTTEHHIPTQVPGLTGGVTTVAAGENFSFALQNGTLLAWGGNYFGQLGDGTTTDRYSLVPVTGLSSGVTAISVGVQHGLALQNGAVFAWGAEQGDPINDYTAADQYTPRAVNGLGSNVTAIAAGVGFNLAIKNGAAYAWGKNGEGQLGDGTYNDRWLDPHIVTGLTSGVTAIAAGYTHSLFVRDGYVYGTGDPNNGCLGQTLDFALTPILIDPTDLHDIVTVAAGDEASYAIASDGTLWAWGETPIGELTGGYDIPQRILPPPGYVFTSFDTTPFILQELVATIAPVPEPSSFALLAFGTAILFRQFRRRAPQFQESLDL